MTGLGIAPALAATSGPGPVAVAAGGSVPRHPVSPARATALAGSLTGLPSDTATSALLRVGGSGGTWRGSSGVHDLASGRPADADARFRAGSTTKTFTAAVVLQLADEGRVRLDRPARAYLPDLIPDRYKAVTVRQLLDHTSGIPAAASPVSGVDEAYAHRFDRTTPQALVASATGREREFAPGTAQHYLNINYTVLGLLVERVTGRSYEEEVTRRVIRPLGLRGTYLPGADPVIKGAHNRGYQVFDLPGGGTELRDVSDWDQTYSWAAGDLVSTTADLERFVTALFRGQVVKGHALKEMFTLPGAEVHMYDPEHGTSQEPAPAAYSAGLSTTTIGDTVVWGKTGSRYGYLSGVFATRDLSRTLVYSVGGTDAKGPGMSATAFGIANAAFGPLETPPGHTGDMENTMRR